MLKKIILDIVNESNGIKGVELASKVVSKTTLYSSEEFITVLEALVKSGQIREIEYIVPSMDYRIKSMYFPKGTSFKIV